MVLNKFLSKRHSASLKTLFLTFFAFILFYAPLAYSTPDVGTMLMNFAQTIPNFMQLVTGTAYVMGFFFVYKGILGLREFGESRTQMTAQHSLKGPLILIGVGTALIYLPSSVEVALNTFWTSSPISYIQDTDTQWSSLYQDAFLITQLIGTIAFIRGLIIFTHLSGQGAQPGTFGKGLTHIIGGALLINLNGFLTAVANTFGAGS